MVVAYGLGKFFMVSQDSQYFITHLGVPLDNCHLFIYQGFLLVKDFLRHDYFTYVVEFYSLSELPYLVWSPAKFPVQGCCHIAGFFIMVLFILELLAVLFQESHYNFLLYVFVVLVLVLVHI